MSREIKRAVHIDFHTMPGIYDFGEAFDADEFAQTLHDAEVGYINMAARCNIGFAYYPTKIGTPYPGMKGDMLGEIIEACHKRDIGVSAYVNAGLDHDHCLKHADWLRIDKEGRVIRGDIMENFFRTVCYNSPGYKNYFLGMLSEICEYDIDGLFLDCMAIEPCYCYHCVSRMKKAGIDPFDVSANMKFQEECLLEYCREVKRMIGDKNLFFNGMHMAAVNEIETHFEVECLPSGWSYDFFWPHISYARSFGKKIVYMTGRFQVNWGDFGGFKSKASLEYDYYDALMSGAEVSVGDHMHPAQGLNKNVYKVVGEMNRWKKKLEPYLEKVKPVSEIGVLINQKRDLPVNGNLCEGGTYMSSSYSGLARMFGELKYSYDIINETMDFDPYCLLILPDEVKMNEVLQSKLEAYVRKGGKLLSSGVSGLDKDEKGFVAGYDGIDFRGIDHANASYFRFSEIPCEDIYDMEYAMYSNTGVLMDGRNQVATYIKAYHNKEWDGLHSYFYTPPEKANGHAAAAFSVCGNICHICFSAFRAYATSAAYHIKALVKMCVEKLYETPVLKTEGIPSTARVSFSNGMDFGLIHIKVTYPEPRCDMDIIEEHQTLKKGSCVLVRGQYREACMLPDREKVEIEYADGYTKVILPEIIGYGLVQILPKGYDKV